MKVNVNPIKRVEGNEYHLIYHTVSNSHVADIKSVLDRAKIKYRSVKTRGVVSIFADVKFNYDSVLPEISFLNKISNGVGIKHVAGRGKIHGGYYNWSESSNYGNGFYKVNDTDNDGVVTQYECLAENDQYDDYKYSVVFYTERKPTSQNFNDAIAIDEIMDFLQEYFNEYAK